MWNLPVMSGSTEEHSVTSTSFFLFPPILCINQLLALLWNIARLWPHSTTCCYHQTPQLLDWSPCRLVSTKWQITYNLNYCPAQNLLKTSLFYASPSLPPPWPNLTGFANCPLPAPALLTSLLILNKPHTPQGLCPGRSFCLTLSMLAICMAYSLLSFQSWFKRGLNPPASPAIAENSPLLLLCLSPWCSLPPAHLPYRLSSSARISGLRRGLLLSCKSGCRRRRWRTPPVVLHQRSQRTVLMWC